MKFAIITHVIHKKEQNHFFAYAPYVNEMNIWSKYIDELIIVAPLQNSKKSTIDSVYNSGNVKFMPIQQISLVGRLEVIKAILNLPKISWQIYKAMSQSNHIHLRCPGNIGLLGCLIQILFPNKKKTAKYAGNWDPESKQPLSYRLQKWILSNTFLTKNMQVLVYGEWKNLSKNIVPFFTATYLESDKDLFQVKGLAKKINFIFVGTLVEGKNPLYAIQLIEELYKKGFIVHLDLYGEGLEGELLKDYISNSNLEKVVKLKGNQPKDVVKDAYQGSHFVILPSKSEGWPKAIAEGMFWGCVPIATAVSCVPFMLDFGNRGLLLQMNLEEDVQQLITLLNNESGFLDKSKKASDWSRNYTLDVFEVEIKKMLLQ
ncbi:glycosyltransferase [Flavobacterium sp. 5]|uniref:glycosyltransferase n=1 Tax=Flavobacterium sp. 5 TaxID=2035199 RepID=UPI000C2C268E|nr:glycosyltransferase [Flavobacterium sp. 5]PKB17475.1 glycosyltransferase involved in cell wall biosynthesis [Flavobacterium sp. 5]